VSKSNSLETTFLSLFSAKSEITIQDVMKTFSTSRASANRQVYKFLEQGFIKKLG
jgi:predicted transcriptional regulator